MTERVDGQQRERGGNSLALEGGLCSTPLQKYIAAET